MKESILKTVGSGNFIFEIIGPKIKNEFISDLRLSPEKNYSLSYLSALKFKNIDVKIDESHGRLDFPAGANGWDDLTDSIFPGAKVKPSNLRSLIEIEFKKLVDHPSLIYKPFSNWISHIVYTPKLVSLGASSPYAIGTIFFGKKLDSATNDTIAASLVHEAGHQELFLVNMVDRLVKPTAKQRIAYSPLQKRKRPSIGRLHALVACFRMIQQKRVFGLDDTELKTKFKETYGSFLKDELTEFAFDYTFTMQKAVHDS